MASANSKTLEAMWSFLTTLTPETDLQEYTKFFTPTATVYLSGMGQPPSTSHESLLAVLKTLLSYWAIQERKVTIHVEGADGTIVNAMEHNLTIMGEVVEGFAECEVVKFEKKSGRIEEYLLYCDPAPIMAVFAKKAAEKEG
jgi:limonene-1,2-epoxide hydrolase